MSKLIVGCGYVGRRLAAHWLAENEKVWVTTRNQERADEFARLGLHPLILDVTSESDVDLPRVDTVVFAVGYDRSGPHKIDEVYVDGLKRIVDRCPSSVTKFIYVSSTGVYGQRDGEWVDEDSPCIPIRDGGKACLAAEQLLMSVRTLAKKAIVLRIAGIYGPGRLPQARLLQLGEPLKVAAEGYLNLIHVDDLVQIIAEIEARLIPPLSLCVSDGHPVRRGDFYNYLAELLGCDAPSFASPEPGSSQAARARGAKRLRVDRLNELVKSDREYPTYREGLAAIVAGDDMQR